MKRGTKITESSLNRLKEYSKKKYNIQNSRELTKFFYNELCGENKIAGFTFADNIKFNIIQTIKANLTGISSPSEKKYYKKIYKYFNNKNSEEDKLILKVDGVPVNNGTDIIVALADLMEAYNVEVKKHNRPLNILKAVNSVISKIIKVPALIFNTFFESLKKEHIFTKEDMFIFISRLIISSEVNRYIIPKYDELYKIKETKQNDQIRFNKKIEIINTTLNICRNFIK